MAMIVISWARVLTAAVSGRVPRADLVATSNWPLVVDGIEYSFPDADRLDSAGPSTEVGGREPADSSVPPVLAQSALSGPFPPNDLPNPGPDVLHPPDFQPPDRPATPFAPLPTPPAAPPPSTSGTPCQPTLLFYVLSFMDRYKEENGEAKEPWDALEVADAAAARGYTTTIGVSGGKAPDGSKPAATFDDMMAGFERDLATHTSFCSCPEDQLVIYLNAHGGDWSFGFEKTAEDDDIVLRTTFFDRLASIPAIAAHPEKVVLILDSCHSGTVLAGGDIPKTLAGMHLIVSTADPAASSYGVFRSWLVAVLKNPRIQSWADLIAGLKWHQANEKNVTDTPQVGNGDVGNCLVEVLITKVKYTGQDVGPIDSYVRVNRKAWDPWSARKTDYGKDEDLQRTLLEKRVLGVCRDVVRLVFEIDACSSDFHYIQATHAHTTEARTVICDGSSSDFEFGVDIPEPGGPKKGRLSYSFKVNTAC